MNTPPVAVEVLPVTPLQQSCSLIVRTATRKAALVDPGGEVERLHHPHVAGRLFGSG